MNRNRRREEFRALITFGAQSRCQTGFGMLDGAGNIVPEDGAQLWVNCRMTHIFSLGALLGITGCAELAAYGIAALSRNFADHENGGWYACISPKLDGDGQVLVKSDRKEAYAHAFVVLAASSAAAADIIGSQQLLADALLDQQEHWWEESAGRVRESWNREYTQAEKYRGANANMHTVEAYLGAYDATADRIWLDRAGEITQHIILEEAASNRWRVPEHYHDDWSRWDDYNFDHQDDQFRPYGATPGHGFEWARLSLQIWDSYRRLGEVPERLKGIPEASASLCDRAWEDSWSNNGGFCYTTDFDGKPIVKSRMHWVICEAIGCLATIAKMGDVYSEETIKRARTRLALVYDFAETHLIQSTGAWYHELDENNNPSFEVWPGKPDIYHAAQAMIIEDLPVSPGFAKALLEEKKANS